MLRELITLRIDVELRRRLAAAARRRGDTPSELARHAIELWLLHEEGHVRSTPADFVGDVVGCVAGGAPDRSTSSDFLGRPSRRAPARRSRTAKRKK